MEDELVKHIFEELKEIRDGVNKLVGSDTNTKERLAALETTNNLGKRETNIRFQTLQLIVPSLISLGILFASKLSGLIR